jgi:hypothetical protein
MANSLEQQIRNQWNNTEKKNTSKFTTDETVADQTKGGFSIEVLQFPDYLGTKELNQYVLFNINVRGKSEIKLGNEKRIAVVNRENTAQQTEKQLSAASTASLGVGGAVLGGAVSQIFTAMARNKRAKSGIPQDSLAKSQDTKTTVIGTGVGALTGAALSATKLFSPDTSYRISDAIALYINEPPQVKYSALYDNKELGTLAGLVGGISTGAILGTSGEAAQAAVMEAAKIPQSMGLGLGGDAKSAISASSKVTINPFKEVLFTGIDFRSFQFKYRFMPKSKQEADQVKAIIDRFKFHMHPELSENKLFFIYPSEFEISYIYEGKGNQYFHKFKPCVLETMDVTYGGEQYSSFTDGNPTEINLSLLFRETEILTKQQVKAGY